MRITIAFLVLAAAALVHAAIAQQNPPTPPNSDAPPNQNSIEQFFFGDAGEVNLLNRKMGLLAATNASSGDVKALAKTLVAYHDKLFLQLSDLAKVKKQTLPEKLGKADQAEFEKMSELQGERFDKRFVANMVTLQEKGVNWFGKTAKEARDADVKALASGALPTMEKHLKEARALKEKWDKESESETRKQPASKPAPDTPAEKPEKPDAPKPAEKP